MSLHRTHLRRDDLDWLPPRYRLLRWGIAGSIWGAAATTSVVAALFAPQGAWGLSKLFPGMVAAGYWAGDGAARRALRGRLRQLAHGEVELARLPAEPDGELIHVVGRVRARAPLGGLLRPGAHAVFRRVQFAWGTQHLVDEMGEDFWLETGAGEPVLVELRGARCLFVSAVRGRLPDDSAAVRYLEALPLPPRADRGLAQRKRRRARGRRVSPTRVAESLLCDGDEVEVLGYKSRVVDPTVAPRLLRDTPYRVTLRGGRELPLLLSPRGGRAPVGHDE